VAGDAALLVDPYDVEAISGAMLRLLQDDGLRADLRARGLRRAQEFSWERAADVALAVLRQAAGRPTTARPSAGQPARDEVPA
jgi:glycosyltransferase involved in cell wall biosynthesis